MKTLEDVRFTVEQSVKDQLSNQDIINWCNDAQAEFLLDIGIQTSTTLYLIEKAANLPSDLKTIHRILYGSTEVKDFTVYNGQITFTYDYDELTMDYDKHLTYFESITDEIDLDDRFLSLYSAYCQAQYYDQSDVKTRLTELRALNEYNKHVSRYQKILQQVSSFYGLQKSSGQVSGIYSM